MTYAGPNNFRSDRELIRSALRRAFDEKQPPSERLNELLERLRREEASNSEEA